MNVYLSFLVFSIQYSASFDLVPPRIREPPPAWTLIPKLACQSFCTLEVVEVTSDSLDWCCELTTFMLHCGLGLQFTTATGTFCFAFSWEGLLHSRQVLFSRFQRFILMTKVPLRCILVMSKPSPARLDPGANSASLHWRGCPLKQDGVTGGMRARVTASATKVMHETPMV